MRTWWWFLALGACAPTVDELANDTRVEGLDDTAVPNDATAVWRLDADDAPRLAFESAGLFGLPAAGVWQRYSVQVAERDGDDPSTWSIRVVVDMDSVETGIDRLDEHLRTPDFLDVTGHPEAWFQSTEVVVLDDTRWRVAGDLTVRGRTAPATFDATLARNGDTLRTQAQTTLSRWDHRLYADSVTEPGGDGASDDVTLSYDVTLTRTPRP